MSVPILGHHAPLTGLRADVASGVQRAVKELMVLTLGDQLLHAEIVAAGVFTFRAAFVKDMGPAFGNARGPCGDLADVIHQFFVTQWRLRYPNLSAYQFLDNDTVKAPPTDQEIEDAWEVEIGSSDSAMRQMYEGSARTRKGADIFRFAKGGKQE